MRSFCFFRHGQRRHDPYTTKPQNSRLTGSKPRCIVRSGLRPLGGVHGTPPYHSHQIGVSGWVTNPRLTPDWCEWSEGGHFVGGGRRV